MPLGGIESMKGSVKLTSGMEAISESDSMDDEEKGDIAPQVCNVLMVNSLLLMIKNPRETLAMLSVDGVWPKDLCNLDNRAGGCNLDLLVITFSIFDNVDKVSLGPDDMAFSYRHTGLIECNKVAICP